MIRPKSIFTAIICISPMCETDCLLIIELLGKIELIIAKSLFCIVTVTQSPTAG